MARPYSTRLVAMSLVVTRAFTARPRGLAARGLALRAGDAPDDKVLYALGVNVATQLSDIRKLFEGEEIPKIVEGINARGRRVVSCRCRLAAPAATPRPVCPLGPAPPPLPRGMSTWHPRRRRDPSPDDAPPRPGTCPRR